MAKGFNHDDAGKADIAAKPEVSQRPENQEAAFIPPQPVEAKQDFDLETNELEVSAGKLFAKTTDKLKEHFGAQPDKDFSNLVSEVTAGIFCGARNLSGSKAVTFGIAGITLLFSLSPAILVYLSKKQEEEDNGKRTDNS